VGVEKWARPICNFIYNINAYVVDFYIIVSRSMHHGWPIKEKKIKPRTGVEPATFCLRSKCSTTKLTRREWCRNASFHIMKNINIKICKFRIYSLRLFFFKFHHPLSLCCFKNQLENLFLYFITIFLKNNHPKLNI